MSRSADVVIIGGGIMGSSCALHLLDAGVPRVWLVEKAHLGAGSTGKSGAILRQHYSHPETVRMAMEGLSFYREFEERHGMAIGFRRQGMLLLVNARDRQALEDQVGMQAELGVPTRVVDEAELALIEPRGVYEEDCIGCFEKDAGSVDPRLSVESMAEVARRQGLRLSVGERFEALTTEGDRVVGVRTSHGDIAADHVVIAAGPWSPRLLAEHGVDLPLRVVRPEQAFLEPPATFGEAAPIFADLRLGYYWKNEGPRHTRVGALSYDDDGEVEDPDHYDEAASDAFAQGCRAAVGSRLPAYQRATLWGGCGALYTLTPDSHGVIGPLPGREGCTLVTGFSGHGFKLAPAVGRGVSEWITTGRPSAFPAEFFDPLRFARGEGIASGTEYGILG